MFLNNRPHVAPKHDVPKFTPPRPTKPVINGIYDDQKSSPTIYGVPNGGMKYVVNMTDDFDSPDCYSEVIALLSNATEVDEVWWNIASHGGYVDSLNMLLGWKSMCPAKQVHVLHANADSCASAFYLSPADQYIVGDYATMFIHEFQVGNGGTASNVLKRVEHTSKENERFVRDTYKDFLTEEEIVSVLQGVEIYLDNSEIRERLSKREELKRIQNQQELDAEIEKAESLDDFTDDEIKEEIKALQAELKSRKQKTK